MGSKARIAKDLVPILTKHLTKDRWYVEPFSGGCNMIDKVKHDKRIANDYNKYLIALFKALQQGIELPTEISKEEYDSVRDNKDNYEDWYVGFVGFVCSFRGKFFNGWVNTLCKTKSGITRNFQSELINNFLNQRSSLMDILFYNEMYSDLQIPDSSVIYCDPPYQDTTNYKNESSFNHDDFWQWCREMTAKGHDVLISEYQAPNDFVCVWGQRVKSSFSGVSISSIEKLFVHESIARKYKQETLF